MAKSDVDIKANLVVRLFAGDVLVAETADAVLWNQVLARITGGGEARDSLGAGLDEGSGESSIERLAAELGLEVAEVEGALDPDSEPPFLRLDAKTWERFTEATPSRGQNAVPSIVLAVTALAVWFDVLGLGLPTQAQAQRVLGTIHVTDKNPSRGIRNCEWLRSRGEGVAINPARASKGYAVVRAYCLGTAPTEADNGN